MVFRRNSLQALALVLGVIAVVSPGHAADVEKKWRVGVALGGFNTLDEVESSSANEMATLNPCAETSSCDTGSELVVRAFRDPRNDSQVIFYDQVIPRGTLLGYANGDHWAIALPFTEQAKGFADTLMNHNDFPRTALFEAVLLYVRENL